MARCLYASSTNLCSFPLCYNTENHQGVWVFKSFHSQHRTKHCQYLDHFWKVKSLTLAAFFCLLSSWITKDSWPEVRCCLSRECRSQFPTIGTSNHDPGLQFSSQFRPVSSIKSYDFVGKWCFFYSTRRILFIDCSWLQNHINLNLSSENAQDSMVG